MVIYKITNLLNDKIYIGKDKHNNPNYLGSGRLIKQAIKKYGKQNFKKEVLEYCNTENELCERELFWIKELNSIYTSGGYNLTIGGEGGDTFTYKPDHLKRITKKRLSKQSIKSNNKNIELHRKNSLDNWQNDIYRKKVINGLYNYWSNELNRSRHSKKMKRVCNSEKIKLIRSNNSRGKLNSKWRGYADLYDLNNQFVIRYETFKYMCKDISIYMEDQKLFTIGNNLITIRSSKKIKNKYEGYTILINKNDIPLMQI